MLKEDAFDLAVPPCAILLVQKFSSLGGSQRSLIYHLELLDRRRFQPMVLTSNRGWMTEELDRLGIPWQMLPFYHWTNPLYLPRNLQLVYRLYRLIKQHRIRLLHANEHWLAPQCLLAARLAGIPVICHFRTGLADLTPRRIREYLYGRFDRVVVVAEVLRRALLPHVPYPERVQVVRDGVPLPATPAVFHPQRRSRILINIGAIYPVKGQALIFERLLPWLRGCRKNFLFYVGDNRSRPEYVVQLKETVLRHGLQKQVLFLGSRRDTEKLLQAADGLIAYSTVEGVPRVVMEAMMASRPVWVSCTPGMEEVVIPGQVGHILDFHGDDHSLPTSLDLLRRDYSECEAMGRRARLLAEQQFSTQAMSHALETLYSQLLEKECHG
ncbi:MAG: glycosyltransferase family 4 protein [Magnetococcus sp. MYC-9]